MEPDAQPPDAQAGGQQLVKKDQQLPQIVSLKQDKCYIINHSAQLQSSDSNQQTATAPKVLRTPAHPQQLTQPNVTKLQNLQIEKQNSQIPRTYNPPNVSTSPIPQTLNKNQPPSQPVNAKPQPKLTGLGAPAFKVFDLEKPQNQQLLVEINQQKFEAAVKLFAIKNNVGKQINVTNYIQNMSESGRYYLFNEIAKALRLSCQQVLEFYEIKYMESTTICQNDAIKSQSFTVVQAQVSLVGNQQPVVLTSIEKFKPQLGRLLFKNNFNQKEVQQQFQSKYQVVISDSELFSFRFRVLQSHQLISIFDKLQREHIFKDYYKDKKVVLSQLQQSNINSAFQQVYFELSSHLKMLQYKWFSKHNLVLFLGTQTVNSHYYFSQVSKKVDTELDDIVYYFVYKYSVEVYEDLSSYTQEIDFILQYLLENDNHYFTSLSIKYPDKAFHKPIFMTYVSQRKKQFYTDKQIVTNIACESQQCNKTIKLPLRSVQCESNDHQVNKIQLTSQNTQFEVGSKKISTKISEAPVRAPLINQVVNQLSVQIAEKEQVVDQNHVGNQYLNIQSVGDFASAAKTLVDLSIAPSQIDQIQPQGSDAGPMIQDTRRVKRIPASNQSGNIKERENPDVISISSDSPPPEIGIATVFKDFGDEKRKNCSLPEQNATITAQAFLAALRVVLIQNEAEIPPNVSNYLESLTETSRNHLFQQMAQFLMVSSNTVSDFYKMSYRLQPVAEISKAVPPLLANQQKAQSIDDQRRMLEQQKQMSSAPLIDVIEQKQMQGIYAQSTHIMNSETFEAAVQIFSLMTMNYVQPSVFNFVAKLKEIDQKNLFSELEKVLKIDQTIILKFYEAVYKNQFVQMKNGITLIPQQSVSSFPSQNVTATLLARFKPQLGKLINHNYFNQKATKRQFEAQNRIIVSDPQFKVFKTRVILSTLLKNAFDKIFREVNMNFLFQVCSLSQVQQLNVNAAFQLVYFAISATLQLQQFKLFHKQSLLLLLGVRTVMSNDFFTKVSQEAHVNFEDVVIYFIYTYSADVFVDIAKFQQQIDHILQKQQYNDNQCYDYFSYQYPDISFHKPLFIRFLQLNRRVRDSCKEIGTNIINKQQIQSPAAALERLHNDNHVSVKSIQQQKSSSPEQQYDKKDCQLCHGLGEQDFPKQQLQLFENQKQQTVKSGLYTQHTQIISLAEPEQILDSSVNLRPVSLDTQVFKVRQDRQATSLKIGIRQFEEAVRLFATQTQIEIHSNVPQFVGNMTEFGRQCLFAELGDILKVDDKRIVREFYETDYKQQIAQQTDAKSENGKLVMISVYYDNNCELNVSQPDILSEQSSVVKKEFLNIQSQDIPVVASPVQAVQNSSNEQIAEQLGVQEHSLEHQDILVGNTSEIKNLNPSTQNTNLNAKITKLSQAAEENTKTKHQQLITNAPDFQENIALNLNISNKLEQQTEIDQIDKFAQNQGFKLNGNLNLTIKQQQFETAMKLFAIQSKKGMITDIIKFAESMTETGKASMFAQIATILRVDQRDIRNYYEMVFKRQFAAGQIEQGEEVVQVIGSDIQVLKGVVATDSTKNEQGSVTKSIKQYKPQLGKLLFENNFSGSQTRQQFEAQYQIMFSDQEFTLFREQVFKRHQLQGVFDSLVSKFHFSYDYNQINLTPDQQSSISVAFYKMYFQLSSQQKAQQCRFFSKQNLLILIGLNSIDMKEFFQRVSESVNIKLEDVLNYFIYTYSAEVYEDLSEFMTEIDAILQEQHDNDQQLFDRLSFQYPDKAFHKPLFLSYIRRRRAQGSHQNNEAKSADVPNIDKIPVYLKPTDAKYSNSPLSGPQIRFKQQNSAANSAKADATQIGARRFEAAVRQFAAETLKTQIATPEETRFFIQRLTKPHRSQLIEAVAELLAADVAAVRRYCECYCRAVAAI